MTETTVPETLEWHLDRIDPERMKVLALILDDPNPIHVDRRAVRDLGLGDRRINQGPCNMAFLVNMVQRALPHLVVRDVDVRLIGMAHEGDAVDVEGRLVPSDDPEAVVYEVSATVRGAGRIVDGRITLGARIGSPARGPV